MFAKLTLDFDGVNFPKPYKDPNKLYIGFVAVFSGCRRALRGNPCPDCQNPSLWNGIPVQPNIAWGDNYVGSDKLKYIENYVRTKVENFKAFNMPVEFFYCALGGEPLDQHQITLSVVHRVVEVGANMVMPSVLFTGYTSYKHKDIDPAVIEYVEENIDYVKVGPYLGNSLRQDNLPTGLATANQQWIEIKKRKLL